MNWPNMSREEIEEHLHEVADSNYAAHEKELGPEIMRELENLVMLKSCGYSLDGAAGCYGCAP
jgi:preprotein translocase subunit SecA